MSPYLLLGFGRWGSSDPQGGIPVNFGQICGAKAIVESTLPEMNFMLSQGSHFFHNITSFRVLYFSVPHWEKYTIDWNWLGRQKAVTETEFVRHVRLRSPLTNQSGWNNEPRSHYSCLTSPKISII